MDRCGKGTSRLPKFKKGDCVVGTVFVDSEVTRKSYYETFFGVVHRSEVSKNGKISYYVRSSNPESAYSEEWFDEEDLSHTDEYLRRRTDEDPTFATSDDFRRHASSELRREFPEVGHDFGFFDSVRESGPVLLYESWRDWGDPGFDIGDRVVWSEGIEHPDLGFGKSYAIVGKVMGTETRKSTGKYYIVEFEFIGDNLGKDRIRNLKLHGRQIQKLEKYLERFRSYPTSLSEYMRFLPRDVQSRYPEYGADFGFFDSKRS